MNNPFGRIWSTSKLAFAGSRGNAYRGAMRVAGGMAGGAIAGSMVGDGHGFSGAMVGGLAGAAGHTAMRGRSLRWAAAGWGRTSAYAKRIPNIF